MRQILKSYLSENQINFIRAAILLCKKPIALYRRQGINKRLGRIVGRSWHSDIPYDLHYSTQRGTINYTYRNIPMLKHPMDIANYMELIWKLKPKTIIEIGSKDGGSAIWFADLLKTYGIDGHIYSIDIIQPPLKYDGVTFMYGNGEYLLKVPLYFESLPKPWLVIEDASHHYNVTKQVLKFFYPMLKKGDYIVVEDANVSHLGDDIARAGGPGKATAEFLNKHIEYQVDKDYCDRYGYNTTGNPNGYLKRWC